MSDNEKDLKTELNAGHLCPICEHPMDAEEIESPNVNPGRSTKVWHCNNPGCYDSLREQYHTFDDPDPEIGNPYLLRYDSIKEPERGGFARVHIGSFSAPETGRLHFCPFCDNEVEVLDSVYCIWNCPNCLLVRSGGLIERYYPIEEDGTIDTDKEIREQRRGLPRWAPFAPLEDDEEEGEE